MAKNYKQEIDLSELPRWGGEGMGNPNTTNWQKSIGYKVSGIYDGIIFEVKIIDYKIKKHKLMIEYNEKLYEINTDLFKQCKIGKILGKITSEFKIEIGTNFKDKKRDITITDREHRKEENIDKQGRKSILNDKYYKYHCNQCGWDEGWIVEGALEFGNGCPVCYGLVVVNGINSIVDTDKWLIPYFQGGYDEAKLYTKTGSGNPNNRYGKIIPICPDCGRIKSKKMAISDIYTRHSIGCSCSDSISFGEKAMFSVLEQLGIEFQTQLNKSIFKWCKDYKYDFYFELNNEQIIIETHGIQHYEQTTRKGARSLEEEQENDKFKKELALKNGILEKNYIVIDCRKSQLEFIKQNILDSRLNELFNLNTMNWMNVGKFALSNRTKEACEYKKNNTELTTSNIAIIMKMSSSTIRNYLNEGNKIGWCKYNIQEERVKSSIHNGKANGKQVEIFKDGKSLGVFPSVMELLRKSEELFNIKLYQRYVSEVCLGKRTQYKGFVFIYI